MAGRIEDYALIGDTQSAALVGRDGSIDWMCLPRFDSDACFAALLGKDGHGRWKIAPRGEIRKIERRYRPETLVLETTFHTDDGVVRVVDCMPPRTKDPDVIRVIEGVSGRVPMRMDLCIRFNYGATLPWIRRTGERSVTALAGPDALSLFSDAAVELEDSHISADLEIAAGERTSFLLVWHPSTDQPRCPDCKFDAVTDTEAWWREWASKLSYQGDWREAVLRSLITLKALTYLPTGGIVAAPTTSLPERIGGVRNWDYRYCWLRDATFTLLALIGSGFYAEANAWVDWLLRAAAGHPAQLQILYGPAGERRVTELELPWLPGYEGSRPVRIGNAAASQLQLDVYGELFDCLYQARLAGIGLDDEAWALQRGLIEYLEEHWREPDEGIWEVRGTRQHFTHSKVMAWVAMDRAVREVERFGLPGPVERWRAMRDEIHAEVCARGFDPVRGTFTQHYGGGPLDASLLQIPLVGFLPPEDPRVVGTVEAIRRELSRDGFIMRYRRDHFDDGLPNDEEGVFLPCTFWLVDCLALMGRRDEARELFERLLALCNDVGLVSEEYDTRLRRLVGNFPQALSHVAIVDSACNLTHAKGPAESRRQG